MRWSWRRSRRARTSPACLATPSSGSIYTKSSENFLVAACPEDGRDDATERLEPELPGRGLDFVHDPPPCLRRLHDAAARNLAAAGLELGLDQADDRAA